MTAMQITFNSTEPLADVLRVIGTLYNVRLTTAEAPVPPNTVDNKSRHTARRGGRKATVKQAGGTADSRAVRLWAKENGLAVNGRGALSKAIHDAYAVAHPS